MTQKFSSKLYFWANETKVLIKWCGVLKPLTQYKILKHPFWQRFAKWHDRKPIQGKLKLEEVILLHYICQYNCEENWNWLKNKFIYFCYNAEFWAYTYNKNLYTDTLHIKISHHFLHCFGWACQSKMCAITKKCVVHILFLFCESRIEMQRSLTYAEQLHLLLFLIQKRSFAIAI